MASNEECDGSAFVENCLQFKSMDMFDVLFFNYLCEKNDQCFACEWDRHEEVLKVKIDTEDEKEIAFRLYRTVKNCFKKVYELNEEEMKTSLNYLKDLVTTNSYSDIFIDATTNSSKRRLAIMASNDYDEMFRECKHKFEVKIGLKRISRTRKSHRRRSSQRPSLKRQVSLLRSSEKTHKFITFEKISVKVITDNLENLDGHVEGIVNPINDKLESNGQVSKILTSRGGDNYVQERQRIYSEKSKSIIPGSVECFVTGVGDLKATGILHVVCPKVQVKDANVENTVFNTVYKCLKIAERERLETVAIPLLYTGNGNIPVERCAVPYALAVLEFSRQRVNTYVVNTIYFIDLDENKTSTLAKYFDDLLPKTFNQIIELPVMHNDIKAETSFLTEPAIQMASENKTSSEAEDAYCALTEPALNDDSCANDEGYEKICSTHDETPSDMACLNSPQSDCQNNEHSKCFDDKETVDNYDTIQFADDDLVTNEQKENISGESVESDKNPKTVVSDDGYDTIQDITDRKSSTKELKTDKHNTTEKQKYRLLIIDETHIDTAVNAEKDVRGNGVVGPSETEQEQDGYKTSIVNEGIDQTLLESLTNVDGGYIIEETGINADGGNTIEVTGTNRDGDGVVDTGTNTNGRDAIVESGIIIDGRDAFEDNGTNTYGGNAIAKSGKNIEGGDAIGENGTNIDGGDVIEERVTNIDGGDAIENTGININRGNDIGSTHCVDIEKQQSHVTSESKTEIIGGNTNAETEHVNKRIDEKPYCNIQVNENRNSKHDYYNLGGESLEHKLLMGQSAEVINRSNSSQVVQQRSQQFQYTLTDKLSVEILKGDIREAQADVIVCPEIKGTKYGGLLTVAIKSAYRDKTGLETPKKIKSSKGKRIATTNCLERAAGASKLNVKNVKFLYHVQTIVYKKPEDETNLTRSIDLVFRKLKKHRNRHVESIAFPLLGIEDVSDKDCVHKCCEMMAKEVYKSCRKYEADIVPLKVMLINRCGQITEKLNKEIKLCSHTT